MNVIERSQFFVGGAWVGPKGDGIVEVISPNDESLIGHFPEATTADVDVAVETARRAFDDGSWRRAPVQQRIDVARRLGTLIGSRSGEFIQLIINEMGAPISGGAGAAGQVLGVPVLVDLLTGFATDFPWISERSAPGGVSRSLVVHEPVGVVGAIIPWNGPLFLAMAKMVPALISGCTVVVKPAPETALDAYLLAEIASEAGIPPGVLSIVPGGREAGAHLVAHPLVDKITFTGSTAAGRQIAAVCGQQLKRASLELGGKSAAIVLDDADMSTTIPALVAGGLGNNGQQCFALSRVLVSSTRHGELVDALASTFGALRVGHALDPATELGPLISAAQRDRVEGYIARGTSDGARILTGGRRPTGLDKGWYVEPTLLDGVDNRSAVAQEEIFGPVISVIEYRDEADALAKANDSIFGLSGAVFTEDVSHGVDIAREVRTGTFHVNHFGGNLAAPFGGFKCSGIGREWGPEGLSDFTELKTINLPPAAG